MRLDYMQSMIGKKQRVLIEKVSEEGIASGYGEHYLPIEFAVVDRTTNRFEDVVMIGIRGVEDPMMEAMIL
jgi:threonylcarbamoyladenosine tRNA methylthiotransferase MtaB